MLNDVAAVLTQVKADIETAWGLDADAIFLGRPQLPKDFEHAVVTIPVPIERRNVGPRSREEVIALDIYGEFDLEEDEDLLLLQLARLKELGDVLCPEASFVGLELPSPSEYGGVGRGMRVPGVECPPIEQGTTRYGVVLSFMVTVDSANE